MEYCENMQYFIYKLRSFCFYIFYLIVSGSPSKHWEKAIEEKSRQLEVFAETVKIQMGGLQKEVSEIKEELAKFSNHYTELLEHCDLRFYEK
jgi:hypothetical protein